MDVFPEKCFPWRYQKDSLQMQYFGGLGSNRNIDVADSNVQNRHFSSQHVPFESDWYCASGPALPLSSSPARVPYPFEDRVANEIKRQKNDAEVFCSRLKTMRAGLKKSRNTTMQKSFKDVLEQLETTKRAKDFDTKEMSVPTWIEDLVKQYEKVKDIQKVKNYNSKYTGGCLSRVGNEATDGKQLIISPADHNFDSVALLELSTTSQVLSLTQKQSVELGYELFQLLSKRCRSLDYSVIRGEEVCEIFTHQQSSEGTSCVMTSVGKESFPGERLTSVDLSVYIPSECLVASDLGNFYLWTPGQSKSVVRARQNSRFPSHESWRQVLFGSHPRHIVMADSTAIQLADIRGHSSTSVDLFALPSKLLNPEERLCLVERHPSSHHAYLIASNKSLLLMDDRFPGCPMLQWNHMLRKPPQVASSTLLDEYRVLVAVGSLSPAEVVACQYRYGLAGLPPQSLGTPWRFSQFGDFTNLPDMCNPLHKFAADQRFETSLTGVSLLNTPSGFCLIQLDSQGELYYQQFEKSLDTREVRFCGGVGSGEVSLDRLMVDRGKKWTQDLHDYVNSCKSAAHKVNVTDVFSEVTLNAPGHVSCPLCMPDTSDLQLDIPTLALCYSCRHLVSDAKVIADAKYNNIVQSVGLTETDDREVTGVDGMELCPLGQILLHQWNEDSEEEAEDKFQELLAKRNEEIKERRKSLKKIASVTLHKEVSTMVEGQISPPLVAPDNEEHVPDTRELQNVISRYTVGTGLSGQRNVDTAAKVSVVMDEGGRDSEDEKDDRQGEVSEADTPDRKPLSEQRGTDSPERQEGEVSGVFVSQVERDYPFIKQSPRKRRRTSHGSDRVSNLSSVSQWSEGFLATPPRLRSWHSTGQDRAPGSADKSDIDTPDGPEARKFGLLCSSPQYPVSTSGRTRHHSMSNSSSRQSVKSNISVQSDGFRSTPSRLHILNSQAKRSRVTSPDQGSVQSSGSDLNSSVDLFDSSLKPFDLLRSVSPLGSPGTQPNNSQTDSQGRKNVKKQFMSGF